MSGCGAALDLRDDLVELFGEVGGRAVIACAPESAEEIESVAGELSVPLRRIGEAGGGTLLGVELPRLRSRLGAERLTCVVSSESVRRSGTSPVSRTSACSRSSTAGQESAGIAVSDGGRLTVVREMGLVAHVFDEQQLQALPGEVAIGHTRYSTTGANKWSNAQPHIHHGSARTIALGHNGNLVNVEELRAELIADGDPTRVGIGHGADRRADRVAMRPRSSRRSRTRCAGSRARTR